MSRSGLEPGDRVEMTGVMPGEPDPLPVGAQGIVRHVWNVDTDREQVDVRWDDPRRSLMLVPEDSYRVVAPE